MDTRHGRRPTVTRRSPPPLRTFDLFAGIGGFRAGALRSRNPQLEFVGSSEIDPYANKVYRELFGPNGELHVPDIRDITQSASGAKDPRRVKAALPSFDLLLAGFPCQPHSLMGNRQGLEDERGTLFYDIAQVLRAVEPRHFVLENVRAIKSVNEGRLFRQILTVLRDQLGYNLRLWDLNAADYGVPQIRRRLFFVGSYDALPTDPPPRIPLKRQRYPTTWHLLERGVDRRYYLSSRILSTILKHQHKGYSRRAEINRLIARPLTRTMHKMHRASQDNYYSDAFIEGVFDETSWSVTLARRGRKRIRRITPREALRIHAFPENLVERAVGLGISDTRMYMLAGNAVPPALVRAVVRHAFRERVCQESRSSLSG
jgi:DNA (cytosine-5)-methyltransferase 1